MADRRRGGHAPPEGSTVPGDGSDDGLWHRIERGKGQPLILLHGGGASSKTWLPILDRLAEHRRVIAFDIPGFGQTPLPPDVEIGMEWLVDELAIELKRIGIDAPVDLAGNSMGGLIALEAAKDGLARSVVGIAPAGLWRDRMPTVLRTQFAAMEAAVEILRQPRVLDVVKHIPGSRSLLLGMAVARPRAVRWHEVEHLIHNLHGCRDLMSVILRMARDGYAFAGGRDLDLPITIAFGNKDRMLTPGRCRQRDELPDHTEWVTLPDCGHVPMWDAPELVARTILAGTGSADAPDAGARA